MYSYKSIAVLLKFKTSNKLFHWKLIQEKHKHLVTVHRLIGTLLTRKCFDVFLLFYGNVNILLCWYLNFPFSFYFWSIMLFPDNLVIKFVFLLCLGFIWVCWTAVATILAFFAPYLLNFYHCRSAIFATTPFLGSLRFLCLYW